MKNIRNLTLTAMFAALIAVLTMIAIKIPTPGGGYVHLGDSLIYVAAALLGPVPGMFAAAVGSVIADLILAPAYAPFTLVIKGLMGLACGLVVRRSSSGGKGFLAGAVLGGLIMLVGYFFVDYMVFGNFIFPGIQLAFNSVQLVFGVAGGYVVLAGVTRIVKQFGGTKK